MTFSFQEKVFWSTILLNPFDKSFIIYAMIAVATLHTMNAVSLKAFDMGTKVTFQQSVIPQTTHKFLIHHD